MFLNHDRKMFYPLSKCTSSVLLQLLTIGKNDPLIAVSLQRHFANGYKNIFQSLNFLKMVRKFGKSFQINLNLDVYVWKFPFLTLWLFADRGRRTALIDGNMWTFKFLYLYFLCIILTDMEIVVNCPQFATRSFKILHLNNPLRRLCIGIVLNP